jgi:hypothetical protein
MSAGARVVEPEWLDELPPADPRARRSRQDLVRINALMGNAGIVAGELRRIGSLRSVSVLGAGDGVFMVKVMARVGAAEARVILVDRHPLNAGVLAADAFEWLADPRTPAFDAIVANLFLHHFEGAWLERLLALAAARCRTFVACEPRRSRVALTGARLLGVVGCNDVSRHDAVVSVRAGFAGTELTALWPREGWMCQESPRGLFSHLFVARRS